MVKSSELQILIEKIDAEKSKNRLLAYLELAKKLRDQSDDEEKR